MRSSPPTAAGGYPVVGHTVSFLRDPLSTLEQYGTQSEGLLGLHVGGKRLCLVTDPAAVESVLATDHQKFRKASIVRDRLGTLQGGSLVLLDGEQWRDRRETLQPAFVRDRIAAMGSITTDHTAAALRAWPRDRPVRIVDSCRTLALGILAEALFGLELEGDRTPVHEAADDILARMDLRSVSAYLPEWVPTPRNVRFRRAIGTLHERLDTTVDQQRQNEVIGENLLSIMLAAGLDPETIRDELIAFLFAGYDSTATALSCTLGLLAEHTETQSALRSELRSTVGDRSPTPEDLQDLHLLDTVVRESLRLYPPQYILFREPTENVALGGYRIKAGTTLVLPPWLLHRDERFWEAPTAFRPERWKGDDIVGSEQPAYTYIPYGGGPRHCLGASLANQTLRLVTAMVCQRFKLRSAGSLSVTAGPTLSVDEELELKLEQV